MQRVVAALALIAAALPASAYEVAPVSGGGTISGKVTYDGPVPTRKIIPTKDKSVCGDIREEPEIVVGADKGVQDSIVYLKGVQKGKAWEKPAKPPEIVNKDCVFVPHVQALPVGSLVIVNSDPVMHNTHGFLEKATVFNVALPMKGQRIEKKLTRPGLVRVECDAHGWMLAWVYAAENPYYAVTKKDGAFQIGDVPPGSYTLVAWHELTGPVEMPVTVKAGEAADVKVQLKRK